MIAKIAKKLFWPCAVIMLLAFAFLFMKPMASHFFMARQMPNIATITRSSLQSVREENRLTIFIARYVAVSTASEQRFGFSAKKTLIMPGTVRYEVNMAEITPQDLRWDNDRHLLTVYLPPVEIAQPEVDMTAIREYDSGGVLMALTDAERQLDSANRNAAIADLSRQARNSLSMRLAGDAACRAVERAFLMPLKAAGITANVEARFRN
ncbi:MAG: DUF4230 domain-containing protein [Zymomonas mobilis subsp. pomaceae]|uniref:DUF4230 domain-containing protein n=1 Tax=Zymomonas mobilis TaxID=542 RepID=UPI0039E99FB0